MIVNEIFDSLIQTFNKYIYIEKSKFLIQIISGRVMSYFYGQTMTYCQGIMPREIDWDVMNQLGKLQCVHFEQRTINYDNPYMKSMKRCEQALAKIYQIKNFIKSLKEDFKFMKIDSYKVLLDQFEHVIKKQKINDHLYMNKIEDQVQQIHMYFTRQKKQLEGLKKQLIDNLLITALLVTISNSEEFRSLIRNIGDDRLFDCRCFLANRKDLLLIQKSMFRISRGNTMLKHTDIAQEAISNIFHKQFEDIKQKVVCILIHEKGETNVLNNKINRFLSCLDVTRLDIAPNKWEESLQSFERRIKQIQNLQHLTKDAVERQLHKIYEGAGNSGCSYLIYLQGYIKKQKQIYRQLACTRVSQNFIHFNLYIPSQRLPLSIQPSQKVPPLTLTPKQPTKMPPTKFDTTPILEYPQQILNTYGVPTYGEFNPAVLYIVTFGFFIGVMFGDVGHMLMAIPFLLYFKINSWGWTVIFFMGYCGFIYNQFFGLNIGIFSSCYDLPDIHQQTKEQFLHASRQENCVYSFGVDSAWKPAQNQMQFTNSLKMKLAVILGVVHMMLGLGLKVVNCIKRRKIVVLLTLAIPQIIFMVCTFVYMDALIIIKWLHDFTGEQSSKAPSVIATMISVYAGFGNKDDVVLWETQKNLESALFALSAVMVPIMLLGVPLITFIQRKRNKKSNIQLEPIAEVQMVQLDQDHHEQKSNSSEKLGSHTNMFGKSSIVFRKGGKEQQEQEQPIREIFVHQFIETIEYVLGTVSNTASYLRLWALSLAHGQLSEVIFNLILESSVKGGYGGIIGMFFLFPFFYIVTFGILLCMDTMQCFLHSLRLHWVEFQNKFFQGKGYLFEGFSFKTIYIKQQQ